MLVDAESFLSQFKCCVWERKADSGRAVIAQGVFDDEGEAAAVFNSRKVITQRFFNDETAVISSRTAITQGVFDDESEAAAVISSREVITQCI